MLEQGLRPLISISYRLGHVIIRANLKFPASITYVQVGCTRLSIDDLSNYA